MKNTNKVTVTANANGQVITVSPKNPEFGWVAIESIQPTFSEGFLKLGKRVAFIAGSVKELQEFNFIAGEELPGKIVIKETLEPLNAKDATMGIKYPSAAAKKAGLACTVNDQPVYRKSYYTPDTNKLDIMIAHNNGADIIAFNASLNKANAAMPTTAPKTVAK
jgi:hypothetical protein